MGYSEKVDGRMVVEEPNMVTFLDFPGERFLYALPVMSM